MKSILKTALLAAFPIEIVNFWAVGYPTARNSLASATQNAAIALQWYLLHLPGLIAIDRSLRLREHPHACSLVFLVAGYIDTVILVAAILAGARFSYRAAKWFSLRTHGAHP